MQEWLVAHGRSDGDAAAIREGYKEALGKSTLAVLGFGDFARTFSWFASTLRMMGAAGDNRAADADGVSRLPSLISSGSLAGDSPVKEDRAANGELAPAAQKGE